MLTSYGIGVGLKHAVRRALSGGGAPSWSPAALFSSGEKGVWFDPSDLSTMYQQKNGQLVSTVESPVGVILDKSQGLVPGTELISNPGPSFSDTTGWAGTSATLSVVNGRLRVTATGTGFTSAYYRLTGLTTGATYLLSYAFTEGTAGTNIKPNIYTTGPSSNPISMSINANPTSGVPIVIADVDGTIWLSIFTTTPGSIGNYFDIDQVSLKHLPGNHAYQATSAARPYLRNDGTNNYLDFDGVNDVLTCSNPDLGTSATKAVGLSTGASILQEQTIGESAIFNTDNSYGLVLLNRALTVPEKASLTLYLNSKSGVSA